MVTLPFLLTSLVVVAAPGTGALYTLNAGLLRGRRAAVRAAAACTLGTLPHLVAALSGLAALLHASPVVYAVVLWAGIGYLLFMAWGSWRDPGTAHVRAPGRVLRDGIALNLLNPKLTIFFVAFLPQFTDPARGSGQMVVLGLVFMAMTFVVFALYGGAASVLGPRLGGRAAEIANKVFAGCYVALALGLALSR